METALLFFPPPSTFLSSSSSSNSLRYFPPNSFSVTTSPVLRLPLRLSNQTRHLTVCASASSPSSTSDLLDISKLGISDHIVSALSRRGITQLFPIQRAVLEPLLEGRDMIGRAITGSGKTLAFGIPILDKITRNHTHSRKKRVPSALVLAPTRELARQVQREFEESAPNLSSTCLYGGVPIYNQVRSLGFGIDIAVGTPGRIIDLVERGALNLSEIKFVVLDEADQMLAVGFQEDVECILEYLPEQKQCMLFSATMPSWVNDLSKKYLKNPLVVDLVGKSVKKLAQDIALFSIASNASAKQNILPDLISRYGVEGKTIIFTKTRKDAEELSKTMGRIIGSKALHGNMHQLQRDKTIAAFSNGRFNVLVATDVAARGLDIPNVDLVIHFEMPNTSEIFVHRSGRTGRAGKKGTTVLMFTERQRHDVRLIERDIGCKFEELPRIADTGNENGFSRGRSSLYDQDDKPAGQFTQGKWSADSRLNYQNGNLKERNFSTSRLSRERSSGEYQRSRRNNSSSFYQGGQSRNSQPSRDYVEYDDAKDMDDAYNLNGKKTRTSGMNNTRNRTSSRSSGYQTTRTKSGEVYGERSNFSKYNKRPTNFKNDNFDDILDLFKGSY